MSLNEFLNTLSGKPIEEANRIIEGVCGIVDFFEGEDYLVSEEAIREKKEEYGDWQTNYELALKVCRLIKSQGINPEIIVEPTCGTGTFILASMVVFGETVREVFGIEIHKPYLRQLKYRILDYALQNPRAARIRIRLFHQNVFRFDFSDLPFKRGEKILVVGNPPWVTNSRLCEINSDNIPLKSNFKNAKGLDAITGKSNFDIAESITYQLLDALHNQDACMALLIKNSVAKNIVYEQRNGRYHIEEMSQYNIDAKREFDVSVAACLFVAKLGRGQSKQCTVTDFYHPGAATSFGWIDDCFVSNVQNYRQYSTVDGRCQLTWRSGIKHDCSRVMELERKGGKLYNKLEEEVDIEPDLVYPILKSSDLKDEEIRSFRKYVIVTQRRTTDDTSAIRLNQPRTYKYLERHAEWFDKRGSIIYKKRPRFCIFGIGDYSFQQYAVAIAGFYKTTTFSIVCPMEDKCVMLDDTCYLLGFDSREVAQCFLKILNSPTVQNFMQSVVFTDAKRIINKDLLMRIDIKKAAAILLANHYLTQEEYSLADSYINSQSKSSEAQLELSF